MKTGEIQKLLEIMDDAGLSAIRYDDGDVRIELERSAVTQAALPLAAVASGSAAAGAAAPAAEEPVDAGTIVHSPMVGTFYAAPSPDEPAFVQAGQEVVAGQTLCIVEAMKMMNEITAPCAGVVTEVLAANGKQVEYDQPLFRIEG